MKNYWLPRKGKGKLEIKPGKSIASISRPTEGGTSQSNEEISHPVSTEETRKREAKKTPRKENREDTRSPVIVMKTDDIPLKIRQMSGLKRKITMTMTISMTLNQEIGF